MLRYVARRFFIWIFIMDIRKENDTIDDSIQQSINNLMEEYKLNLEAGNRSQKTISWYLEILNSYFTFLLHNDFFNSGIENVGKPELRAYLQYLKTTSKWSKKGMKDKGTLSPFTIEGHVRAIKAFWSWLLRDGHLESNPLEKFPLPKVPKSLIKTLTNDEIRRLLKAVDKSSPTGSRNYLILLLFLDTGIRVSELANIKLSDMDSVDRSMKVLGKGRKERIVFYSVPVKKVISQYIKLYRPSMCNVKSDYLFPTSIGEAISINCVQQFMRRLAVKAGLSPSKCHPHILRHNFATMTLANGANPVYLKEIMGHESFQTTQKYLHPQPQDLRKQHLRYSPVTNLFGDRN